MINSCFKLQRVTHTTDSIQNQLNSCAKLTVEPEVTHYKKWGMLCACCCGAKKLQ
jgi:hypothetical protein